MGGIGVEPANIGDFATEQWMWMRLEKKQQHNLTISYLESTD